MPVSSMPMTTVTVDDGIPVGTIPDDEEILVRAIRGSRARGLTVSQALERLHNVSTGPLNTMLFWNCGRESDRSEIR